MIQTIKSKVIKGYNVGAKFLYKTANISYDVDKINEGVYKINVLVKNKKYSGVGATIKLKRVFESFIFDFEEDIYDEEIEVILLKKIRENNKFDSFEDLKKQIEQDVEFAKNNKIKVMTFGTFDILHPGHLFFLKEASIYGDELITIIARDKNVEMLKGKSPKNNEQLRLETLKNSQISGIVELGDEENPMKCIEKHKPQVICLGYDQKGFYDSMTKDSRYKNIEVIRLKSYKPDIYKSSILRKKQRIT